MPTKSLTKPSTRRLSEVARHVVIPKGIVTTGWPSVQAKAEELGIRYDWWQNAAGRIVLGKRKDGKYAATVGGIVWSIPRQVGKTFTIGSLLVVMCILFPGLKVIWTAHRTRTATSAFRSMQGLAKRKHIAPHISHIRTANGEQEIGFRNGSVIMFGAREQGFGRGFDEVDIEVFDEAQILTEKALEDMVAATNQARHPHGALLFFIGTPPRPVDPGEEFTRRRMKALEGRTQDMFYLEMGADPDADPDDRKQWAKANLSYPKRTPLESMRRRRENVGGVDSWRREGLGIWDDPEEAAKGPIDLKQWATLKGDAQPPERAALMVDVSPDRKRASIGVASDGPDGKILVMVTTGPGTAWVVPEVARLCERRDVVEVAIQPTSQAGSLIPDLVKAGIEFEPLTSTQQGQACAAFIEGVKESRLVHVGQHELDAAVGNARTRYLASGEVEIWDRRKREVDISPLVAVSMAAFRWAQNMDASVYDGRDMVIL